MKPAGTQRAGGAVDHPHQEGDG